MQGFKHAQIGRRARRPGIWRKAEQHDPDLFLRQFALPQSHHAQGFLYKAVDTFGARSHRLGARPVRAAMRTASASVRSMASGKDRRADRPVQLGQGNKHRRLDRTKPLRALGPLTQRLEFQRVRRKIGHIQRLQNFYRGGVVVIGRPADKAETGERHKRVDLHGTGLAEIAVDGRSPVKTAGKSRDHPQPRRLHPTNDHVIMSRVTGQHVRAHQQQPHGALGFSKRGQISLTGRDARRKIGMVKASLRVLDWRCGFSTLPFGPVCISAQQIAHHRLDIVVRSGKPVLHHKEP